MTNLSPDEMTPRIGEGVASNLSRQWETSFAERVQQYESTIADLRADLKNANTVARLAIEDTNTLKAQLAEYDQRLRLAAVEIAEDNAKIQDLTSLAKGWELAAIQVKAQLEAAEKRYQDIEDDAEAELKEVYSKLEAAERDREQWKTRAAEEARRGLKNGGRRLQAEKLLRVVSSITARIADLNPWLPIPQDHLSALAALRTSVDAYLSDVEKSESDKIDA